MGNCLIGALHYSRYKWHLTERIETEKSEPRQRVAAEVAVVVAALAVAVAASLAVVENEWEVCPALPWPRCWPWDSNPL